MLDEKENIACEKEYVEDEVRDIKRQFRLFMNGVASNSMREKGLDYKINWGIPLPRLRQMAAQHTPSVSLAEALWKSEVRECRIMAMLLMPAEACDEDTAWRWARECANQEMAEMLAFNLLQRLPCAQRLAQRMLAEEGAPMVTLGAFHLVSRLLARRVVIDSALAEALAGKVVAALKAGDGVTRHAAQNCVVRCLDSGQAAFSQMRQRLKNDNLDIF